jgi:hypothetical protein
MPVSEWHLPIERGGIRSTVGEYSISAVGPGPRSQRHWKAARDAGLKIGTEIHLNNTCELASIPYLPVLDLGTYGAMGWGESRRELMSGEAAIRVRTSAPASSRVIAG